MPDAKVKSRRAPIRRPPSVRHPGRATAGGRSVAALLRPPAPLPTLQAKLTVGAANDPAEKEADVTAERVLTMKPEFAASGAGAPPEAPCTAAPLRRAAMDQPNTDSLNTEPPMPGEQQDIELPKTEDVETAAIDDSALSEIASGEPEGGGGAPDEEPVAAPKRAPVPAAVGPEGGDAPEGIAARIEHPAPGRPLPKALRADMESRFGADFRDVRIHDRPRDQATATAIGARAFAFKSDIWLGEGERADDRRLIAHELTHVVQQTGREKSLLMSGGSGKEARHTNTPATAERSVVSRGLGEAILETIESYARHIPGYTLIAYLLGKNPITGKPVQRNAENLIYALLGLIPFGTMLADRLKETRALQKAYDWVSGRLKALNITWARVKGAISKAKELFEFFSPISSIKPAFAPLIRDIVVFCLQVKSKIQEFIIQGALALAGPFAQKVWGVIKKAGQTISLILEDPLGFAKNLFKAVGKGFGLFFDNFGKHLKKGLLGFIFGALDGIDITLPDKLDLKGIVSIVFQVLGLTWTRIRKLLVKRLRPNGEKKVAFLEKAVDMLKILVNKGILGIWQKMLSMIDNLTSTVIGGITQFLFTSVLKGAIGWLAGLTNPVGAIIKVMLTIYNFIVMLIERIKQIMELVNSIFGSIAEIARGNVQSAALKVEEAIGHTIPLILAFLAAVIPVSGIATKIQSIIKKLRKPVERAIDKLLQFLAKKAKKVLAKLIGKANSKRKLPSTTFKVGKKTHKLFAKKKGQKVEIYTKTETKATDQSSKDLKKEQATFKKEVKGEELADVMAFIAAFEKQTGEVEKESDQVKLDSKTKAQNKAVKDLEKETKKAGVDLTKYGIKLENDAHVDVNDPDTLIRYKTAISEFEGRTGLYSELAARKKEADKDETRILQLDHNPNKASLLRVQNWLKRQTGSKQSKTVLHFREPKGGRVSAADMAKTSFGQLSVRSAEDKAVSFPAMAIFGQYNVKMGPKDKKRATEMEQILDNNGLSDKGGINVKLIKDKLKKQFMQKSAEIIECYSKDPEPLRKNIDTGNKQMSKLAQDKLKLEGDEKGAADADREDVTGLVRTLDMTGKSGGTDFIANEGASGNYHSLSGKKTLVSFLEADHNPMNSEMKVAATWTLKDVVGADQVKAIVDLEKVQALGKDRRAKVSATIRAGMSTKLNAVDEYTESKGGAIVISRDVNQHDLMTTTDLSKMRKAGNEAFNAGVQQGIVDAAVAGKTGAEAVAGARAAVNAKLRSSVREKIIERQQMTFDLYVSQEAPKVKKANADGNMGDKAVGVLSSIAAKIKSSSTTTTLGGIADRWFP